MSAFDGTDAELRAALDGLLTELHSEAEKARSQAKRFGSTDWQAASLHGFADGLERAHAKLLGLKPRKRGPCLHGRLDLDRCADCGQVFLPSPRRNGGGA